MSTLRDETGSLTSIEGTDIELLTLPMAPVTSGCGADGGGGGKPHTSAPTHREPLQHLSTAAKRWCFVTQTAAVVQELPEDR